MSVEPSHFDFIVVGAGMMGSAAARHLSEQGQSVALVGPSEPANKNDHTGVFASHYDQARITRKLDSNLDWSRLASASIDRYADIETSGDCNFFHPVGSIMAGPEHGVGKDFMHNVALVGADQNIDFTAYRGDQLKDRFPYFSFPDGVLALHEHTDAGWINPRNHVFAEIKFAQNNGAIVFSTEAISIEEYPDCVTVTCADGAKLTGAKVIVACGAFSKQSGLLHDPIPMKSFARTIAFFELPNSEILRLQDMPSLVYTAPDQSCDVYILPPVKYPDGKTYLKIGGDPKDIELKTTQDLKKWFRGNGNPSVGQFLADQLLRLMPNLSYNSLSFGSCTTSFTDTKMPLIYSQSERLIALTGGNGAGAKCSDELGRLGALLALNGSLTGAGYDTSFRP